MLGKEILFNYTHETVSYGTVRDDTEEYYGTFGECVARGEELKADERIAYVFTGFWCPTCNYRVAYAYRA